MALSLSDFGECAILNSRAFSVPLRLLPFDERTTTIGETQLTAARAATLSITRCYRENRFS